MYWRPITLMFSDLPSGGSLRSALAYSRPLLAASWSPLGPELDGFWIDESLANVMIASASSTTAAPTVQPSSRRVLPRICAATAPLRARNFSSAYSRPPSTSTKMISAITSVIL